MARARDGQPGAQAKKRKPSLHWLCVVEVGDTAGPRRSPLRPHLKVFKTVTKPGPKLDERYARKGVYTPGDYGGMRLDLMPAADACGGLESPVLLPKGKKTLDKAYTTLRDELEAAGYTVNRRMGSVYRLYVCGLAKGCLPRSKAGSRGDLYVGQTSKSVEERLAEHRWGHDLSGPERYRSNKYVREHFDEPEPGLIPAGFPELLFCAEHALRVESLLRLWLERDGYTVEGGQERYDVMRRAAARGSLESVLETLRSLVISASGCQCYAADGRQQACYGALLIAGSSTREVRHL